jgi:peptidoglycan-associated lipoprotein
MIRCRLKYHFFFSSLIILSFFITASCAKKSKLSPEARAGIEVPSILEEEAPSELEAKGLGVLIRSQDRAILEKNAQWLKTNPQSNILIEGHCDERGTIEYNLALGDRRANAAREYLISLGIDPRRIATISYGEEKPFDSVHNEEGWSKNRRAHFVLTTK